MQKFFRLCQSALFLTALAIPALAQDAPTITIRKSEGVNIAFKAIGGSNGAAVTKVLANDLHLAAWFTLVDAARAAYTIEGTADGNGLRGKLLDRNGGAVLSKTYRGDTRQVAHEFCDDIVETLTGHPGVASSKIAFVSTKTGKKEIYVSDYDGANLKQLTKDNVISVAPAISPDGRKIAYTGYLSGYADIYLIDLQSGARNRIIKFPGTNSGAAFSPDGGHIACTLSKDGNPELYVLSAGGGGARRLTKTKGVESSPSWGPNGDEIVFVSDDRGSPQLYRIASGGGAPRMISTGANYCTEPSWSPDGKRIAFNTRGGGGFVVAMTDLQTGATRTISGEGNAEDPAWGADSRHIIYSTGTNLILLDVPSGRKTTIISGLGKISEPSWSR